MPSTVGGVLIKIHEQKRTATIPYAQANRLAPSLRCINNFKHPAEQRRYTNKNAVTEKSITSVTCFAKFSFMVKNRSGTMPKQLISSPTNGAPRSFKLPNERGKNLSCASPKDTWLLVNTQAFNVLLSLI